MITLALLWRCLKLDADKILAALPVEVTEPTECKPSRSLAEFAGQLSGFDSMMARARVDAGLTQNALAGAVGVSRGQIGRIECGHGLPSISLFARIHRVLEFDANPMLGRLLGQDVPTQPVHDSGGSTRIMATSGENAYSEPSRSPNPIHRDH